MGAIDWGNLVPAGAFIVGSVLGSVATIRVMRWVLHYMESRQTVLSEKQQRKRDEGDDDSNVGQERS